MSPTALRLLAAVRDNRPQGIDPALRRDPLSVLCVVDRMLRLVNASRPRWWVW